MQAGGIIFVGAHGQLQGAAFEQSLERSHGEREAASFSFRHSFAGPGAHPWPTCTCFCKQIFFSCTKMHYSNSVQVV
eukprot:scaffold22610_cov25-Tisochrysis_lutea.AAC.1